MDLETAAADVVELRYKLSGYVRRADAGDRSQRFYITVRDSSDALICLLDGLDERRVSWDALVADYAALLKRIAP